MNDPIASRELPTPDDDGAANHLPGKRLPPVELRSTDGHRVRLDEFAGRAVVFVYPSIGGPGAENLLDRWTAIPGARGCTPEACSFRDELAGFRAARVEVFGLSSQSGALQREHIEQLSLPYPLLSDESMRLADVIRLPTFDFEGTRYFRRLTLMIARAVIETALYPVFPPEQAAAQALQWINEHSPAA